MHRPPESTPGAGERPEQRMPAQSRPEPSSCERVAALIDAWADGELTREELDLLRRHTGACPACAADFALAEDVAQGFARAPEPVCPPWIAAAVLAQAESETPHPNPLPADAGRGGRRRAFSFGAWLAARLALSGESFRAVLRPALAAGLAATLAAASVLVLSPERPPRATPEEVARAEAQLKLTFAYLGRMGSTTGTLVRDEVIENVLDPTRRALATGAAGGSGATPDGVQR